MKALVLAVALIAGPADDSLLEQREQAGRIGAAIVFVLTVGGLALGARHLTRRAKQAEEEERLTEAFREIDEELARPKKKRR